MCAFATAAGMFFWLCVRCFWGAWALGCYFVPFSGLRREREGDGGGKGETLAGKGPVGRSPSGSGSMWAGAPVWARFAGVSLSVFFGSVSRRLWWSNSKQHCSFHSATNHHRRLVINKYK